MQDTPALIQKQTELRERTRRQQFEVLQLEAELSHLDSELAKVLDIYQQKYIDGALIPHQTAQMNLLKTQATFAVLKEKEARMQSEGTGHEEADALKRTILKLLPN